MKTDGVRHQELLIGRSATRTTWPREAPDGKRSRTRQILLMASFAQRIFEHSSCDFSIAVDEINGIFAINRLESKPRPMLVYLAASWRKKVNRPPLGEPVMRERRNVR